MLTATLFVLGITWVVTGLFRRDPVLLLLHCIMGQLVLLQALVSA